MRLLTSLLTCPVPSSVNRRAADWSSTEQDGGQDGALAGQRRGHERPFGRSTRPRRSPPPARPHQSGASARPGNATGSGASAPGVGLVAPSTSRAVRTAVTLGRARQRVDRHLEVRAASMTLHKPHVISHDSAAQLLGLPTLAQRLSSMSPDWERREPRPRTGSSDTRRRSLIGTSSTSMVCEPWDRQDCCRHRPRARSCPRTGRHRRAGSSASGSRAPGGDRTDVALAQVITARNAISPVRPPGPVPGETLMRLLVEELDLGPIERQFEIQRRDAEGALRLAGRPSPVRVRRPHQNLPAVPRVASASSTRSGRLGGEAATGSAAGKPPHVPPDLGGAFGRPTVRSHGAHHW